MWPSSDEPEGLFGDNALACHSRSTIAGMPADDSKPDRMLVVAAIAVLLVLAGWIASCFVPRDSWILTP